MTLRIYTLGDRDYQFDDDEVPRGAVLADAIIATASVNQAVPEETLTPVEVKAKPVAPKNKAARVAPENK